MLSCCSSASVCFTARQRCWSRAAGSGGPNTKLTCHPHPVIKIGRGLGLFASGARLTVRPTQHNMASQYARCGRLGGLKATAVALLLMLGERKPQSRTRTQLQRCANKSSARTPLPRAGVALAAAPVAASVGAVVPPRCGLSRKQLQGTRSARLCYRGTHPPVLCDVERASVPLSIRVGVAWFVPPRRWLTAAARARAPLASLSKLPALPLMCPLFPAPGNTPYTP